MDGTTNLNNSGSGAGLGGQTYPGGNSVSTQVNVNIGIAVGSTASAGLEEEIWQDIYTQTDATQTYSATEPANYVTYSDRPNLQPSTVNDPATANQTLNQILNPDPDTLQGTLNNFLSYLTATNLSSGSTSNSDSTSGSSTTSASSTTSGTTEDTNTNDDVVVTDPEILARAEETGVPAAQIQTNVLSEQNQEFSNLLQNLPQSDADKLSFAYFNPEQAANLSPELQAQLATIKQEVLQGTIAQFNFSPDWQGIPPDASDFQGKFTNEVDYDFDAALNTMVNQKLADGSLQQADAATFKATLTSMHQGLASGTSTTQGLLKILQGQVTAQLQAKYGFDSSYQQGDAPYYNNVVNGTFSQIYQEKVAQYTGSPPATAAQLALLQQFASVISANPNDPSIPASIKPIVAQQQALLQAYPDPANAGLTPEEQAVAEQILQDAINQTQAQYGLDSTWAPTIPSIIMPGVDAATINRLNSGIAMAKEAVSLATTYGNNLPEGPEKNSFLAYLSVISAAITSLQNAVYAMQAGQSNAMSASSRGKLDMQLNDLAQQDKASKETQKQIQKMASMDSAGMKGLMWIVKIVLLIISVFFGPLAMMAAMAFFADSVVSAAMGQKETGFEKLMDLMSKDLPPAASAALKMLIVLVVGVVCANPWLALDIFTTDANAVSDLVKGCGGNAEAAAISQMVVNAVLMVGVMIIVAIVTGGAATEVEVALFMEQMAASLGTTVSTVSKMVETSMFITDAIVASLQIANSAVTMNNSIVQSKIDMIKGHQESYSEIIQGLIAAIQKLITKLLQLIQSGSTEIASISEFQGKKWSDASQIGTDIAG